MKSALQGESKNAIKYRVFHLKNQSCYCFLIEAATPHCRKYFSWLENIRICPPLNFQNDPLSGSPETSNVPSTVNQPVYHSYERTIISSKAILQKYLYSIFLFSVLEYFKSFHLTCIVCLYGCMYVYSGGIFELNFEVEIFNRLS